MKIDELVRDHYVDLGDIDRDIWRYISMHRYEAANSTLVDLAAKCNASKSAVLRFAQRLGFRGFSEFKYALKAEVEADARDMVDAAVLDRYTAIVSKSLKDFLSRDFTPVFGLSSRAQRCFFTARERSSVRLLKRCVACFWPVTNISMSWKVLMRPQLLRAL